MKHFCVIIKLFFIVMVIPLLVHAESAMYIDVDYPKKSDEIPDANFVGNGKVISKVMPSENLSIYSVIKTDKYYRQDKQKLSFSESGDKWIATWQLTLILGRPQDYGLEGTLYLFVVDRDNLKRIVKYYLNPTYTMHSDMQIKCKAKLKLKIERTID